MRKNKQEKRAEQFATLCTLFEAVWLKRKAKDYYNIDLDDLPSLTSPQARKLAAFVFETLEIED